MIVFNCYAHWHYYQEAGLHLGGDIFHELRHQKSSGFVVGLTGSVPPPDVEGPDE